MFLELCDSVAVYLRFHLALFGKSTRVESRLHNYSNLPNKFFLCKNPEI